MTRPRDDQSGNEDKHIRGGYAPLTEGYTPTDEQDALPEAPPGGTGEQGGEQEDN